MTDNFFRDRLARTPVIAILRGHTPDVTVRLALRCWQAGITLVEVPMKGEWGLAALGAAAEAARSQGVFVGAGTVHTVEDAHRARDAGASFLVAPGLDLDTVRLAREWDMPYLPGAATPTELQQAVAEGVHTLKLFPAGPLGTAWIDAMRGPFPQVGLVAVGGVTATNAAAFLDAGAVGVGVGGALDQGDTIETLARLATTVRTAPGT